jgi:hypothetical protein
VGETQIGPGLRRQGEAFARSTRRFPYRCWSRGRHEEDVAKIQGGRGVCRTGHVCKPTVTLGDLTDRSESHASPIADQGATSLRTSDCVERGRVSSAKGRPLRPSLRSGGSTTFSVIHRIQERDVRILFDIHKHRVQPTGSWNSPPST